MKLRLTLLNSKGRRNVWVYPNMQDPKFYWMTKLFFEIFCHGYNLVQDTLRLLIFTIFLFSILWIRNFFEIWATFEPNKCFDKRYSSFRLLFLTFGWQWSTIILRISLTILWTFKESFVKIQIWAVYLVSFSNFKQNSSLHSKYLINQISIFPIVTKICIKTKTNFVAKTLPNFFVKPF